MVARERFELSSAGPEPAILDRKVVWSEVKDDFVVWAQGRFGKRYVKDLRNILDKHEPVIACAQDIDRLFAGSFPGRRHFWFGVRNLLKFCGSHGWSKTAIEALMDTMPPCPRANADRTVPKEEAVIELLKELRRVPAKYRTFYDVILDGAIRPTHAIEIISSWNGSKLEKADGNIWRYNADIERTQKHTWVLMLTDETLTAINEMGEDKPTELGYLRFQQTRRLLRPKHVQKFAYNMMRKSGVDKDVAEFLSGRRPEGVGARHYAELVSLAEQQYPKYAHQLRELRRKALN